MTGALDPLLAPALQLETRPVIPVRAWAAETAARLTDSLEVIAGHATLERDQQSAGQLANIMEAIGVLAISLVAYSRGVVPKVSAAKPNANLIVPA